MTNVASSLQIPKSDHPRLPIPDGELAINQCPGIDQIPAVRRERHASAADVERAARVAGGADVGMAGEGYPGRVAASGQPTRAAEQAGDGVVAAPTVLLMAQAHVVDDDSGFQTAEQGGCG